MRTYNQSIEEEEYLVVYTLEKWEKTSHNSFDGTGYWAKDGFYQEEDRVFYSDPEDATHVVWFNK